MVHLGPRRDTAWEVVDFKEVAPVPTYFGSQPHISSISPTDITQTFTFDRPLQYTDPYQSPPSRSSKLKSKLSQFGSSRRMSIASQQSGTLLRSLTNSSSSSDDSVYSESSVGSDDSYDDSTKDFSTSQMRDAVIFARNQLLNSSELRKMGGNVLFFEGWTVTKLRKGNQSRLRIQYTGRPAMASWPNSDPCITHPPFLDVLCNNL